MALINGELAHVGRPTGAMAESSPPSQEARLVLIVRTRQRWWAMPLEHVVETMRPLPVEPVADMPGYVRGLSLIRGEPTVVIDLARLFDSGGAGPSNRFVVVRAGGRPAALAVEAVSGVHRVEAASLAEVPPLLRGASTQAVAAIGSLDRELLVVLETARIIPEELWAALAARQVSQS